MSTKPKLYTVRIASAQTGRWRVVEYHPRLRDAVKATNGWRLQRYVVAVFCGNRKVA